MVKEQTLANRVSPDWAGEPEVSELVSDLQGAQSPFGAVTFPFAEVSYVHPQTVINK